MSVEEYLEKHKDRFLDELLTFLAIPSVSTDPESAKHVSDCAVWLAQHLQFIGMPVVEVVSTRGHPIVYAEHCLAGTEATTIVFYGHYDVQPVDPLNLWTNPPFEPTLRDGKVFARGATDDKGQVFLHVKAVEALLAVQGELGINLKFVIEGEEEIGSPNLNGFVADNAEKLSCNAVVVSDTPMFAPGVPGIVYGLRGLAYLQIDVYGPNRDLHSGSYGGVVTNPLQALAHILGALKGDDGRITIPGFYSDVADITIDEQKQLEGLQYNDEKLKIDVGVKSLHGEPGYTSLERLWARPTLDVNGMIGGFTGEGAKTVLPAHAMAKISMRLVPNQHHVSISKLATEYIQSIAPEGVTVKVQALHGADPVLVPTNTPAVRAAVKALEDTYGETCRFTREGGSIPVVQLFDSVLNAPTVLMGFGLSNENAHSPDEHFDLENFYKGMLAASRFYTFMKMA